MDRAIAANQMAIARYNLEVFKLLIAIGCNPEAAARQAVAVSNTLRGIKDE